MEDVERVKILWKKFVSSDADSNIRELWLKAFLTQVLSESFVNKDITKKLYYDSDVAGIIATDFIANVHRVCSEPSETDELAPLKTYLLNNVGWMILKFLNKFQNLNTNRAYELTSLLISLYAVVDPDDCMNIEEANEYLQYSERRSIDDIVQDKLDAIKGKAKSAARSDRKAQCKIQEGADEVDCCSYDASVSSVSSAELELRESWLWTEADTDAISDEYRSPLVDEAQTKGADGYEFRAVVLQLLHRLCADNERLSGPNEQDVVGALMKFCLENLCSLQYRYAKQQNACVDNLRDRLVNLLLICTDRAKASRRLVDSLSQNGTISIFLQLLQEVTNSTNRNDICVNTDYLYSLMYGLLNLFFQLLSQDGIEKNLGNFNKLYRQFIGYSSGRLVDSVIRTFLNKGDPNSIKRVKVIVTFFGLTIVRFKKLRFKCEQTNEDIYDKKLFNIHNYSHHDNLFGKAYKALILSPSAMYDNCCVTSTFTVLLKLMLEDAHSDLSMSLLRVLNHCGACCCMPVHWFVPKILRAAVARRTLLSFAGTRLYRDVGMYERQCDTCANDENRWKCLQEYRTLLMHSDRKVSLIAGLHFAKVYSAMNHSAQSYTLRNVVCELYSEAKRVDDPNVVLLCLSLCSNAATYAKFSTEYDDLMTIKECGRLLSDARFTAATCKLLETRVLCKTVKLESSTGTFTPVLTETSVAELNVLLRCFYAHFDVATKEEEERSVLVFDTAQEFEEYRMTLMKLYWLCCAIERIVVNSATMKTLLQHNPNKERFRDLLQFTLRILSTDVRTPSGETVMDVCLKFVQPLLIVCLSLFPERAEIESAVKGLLNDALKHEKISIKEVCDALLSLEHTERPWPTTDTSDSDERDEYDSDDEFMWTNAERVFSEASDEDTDTRRFVRMLDRCLQSSLLYPTICTIVVDLVNSVRVKCAEETLYCFHYMTTVCKKHPDVCVELTKHNVVVKLLAKLKESLSDELLTPEETDLQFAMMQFVSVLLCYSADRKETDEFFELFRCERPPYDYLISAMLTIASNSKNTVQPTFYLTFPVPGTDEMLVSEDDDPAEALAYSMREIQRHAAIPSPWVVCAVTLPLNTRLDWCIWLTGFSMSFWLRYESEGRNGTVHVVSVGYDTLLLEMWMQEESACLGIRLSRPEGNSFEVLSEAKFQKQFDDNWHHVALNVKDTMRQQKIALEVSLLVDGEEETKYLLFQGIFMRKVRPACIMIGETRTTQSRYEFANFMMFRAPILTRSRCLTVCAYGPDAENVISAAYCAKPNFGALLRDATPDMRLAELVDTFDENLRTMQDNMLITFSPRDTSHFYYYLQSDNSSSSMSLFPPATPALFKKFPRSGQRVPHPMKVIQLAEVKTQLRKTFYACVNEIGGFTFLAYLFARIVETTDAENIQCDALKMLFRAALCDTRVHADLERWNGYELVSVVIASGRFKFGAKAFKALMDSVCNKKAHFEDENYVKSELYIVKPEIISRVVLPNWTRWEKSEEKLLARLYNGLHSLIDDGHPYKQLNVEQLNTIGLVELTFEICKEKSLIDGCEVDEELCTAILRFLKQMIGYPPNEKHLRSMVDYLYVVHSTSLTYVTHSTSGFYFLFSSITQPNARREDMKADRRERGLYSRNLSQSLVDLQEKRRMLNDFLNATEELKQENDDVYKDKTDSGIADTNMDDQSEAGTYNSGPMTGEYDYFMPGTRQSAMGNNMSSHFFTYMTPPDYENRLFSEHEDCDNYTMTDGLLNLLRDVMSNLPVGAKLPKIVDAKLLLVLANHPNERVRATVVKALLPWMTRCSDEELKKFVTQEKGFYHLANQLAAYFSTEEIVAGCISLLSRHQWDALHQPDLEEAPLPDIYFAALPPLLAVFPRIAHDVQLALNTMRFLKTLLVRVPQALRRLVEHGLVESLIKTTLALIHAEVNCSVEESSVLLNEIINLFCAIVSMCVQTPGVLYLQMLNEIVFKCRYLEVTEEANCGTEKECVHIIHNLHCSVLQSGLDMVLSLIDIYHSQDFLKGRRSPSFLTSMTGSMSASLSSIPSSIMSFAYSGAKQKQLPKGELIDRYKLIINRATEYLQFSSSSVVTEKDKKFACNLFSTLINGVSNIVQNKPYIRIGSPWSSVFWSVRETLRTQASNLLIWMLSPERPVHLRIYVIEVLLSEPKAKDIISSLLYINVETEHRFVLFLWHLMYSKSCDLTDNEAEIAEEFKNSLQEWEVISAQAIGSAHDRWQFDVTSGMRELSSEYWKSEKKQQGAVYKCVYKWESLSKAISERALSISSNVTERQGKERKKLLNNLREKYKLNAEARTRWRSIVQQMTHEKAPWFDPDSYPESWELDPTEGPARIRKRLRRCRLNMEKRFLKPEHSNKIKTDISGPLSYLFSKNDDVKPFYAMTFDNLSSEDLISHMCYATNVLPSEEIEGELLLGSKSLYFVSMKETDSSNKIQDADQHVFIIMFDDIKEIHNRRFQLKERAIEIFLVNGKSYLIALNTHVERDMFIAALSECSLPNRILNDMLLGDTVDKWKEGSILNWEYLMSLNKMAGRSYNDLMQYPVLPFILADYKNETIDLTDEKIYRNLKKPMAVQDKKKEAYFVNHYSYLKSDSYAQQNMSSIKQQPYHYASHYSNSGTVLHFLVRLPPFTQIFLEYQDNNFDLPDRTFHSLETTWKLTSSDSTTDVKELIPEFFYLPEFLTNFEGFNLGVRQNGDAVNDVKLPAWSKGDARLFILVHRQMLESEYVREHLPHWIDLVFGFKQTGRAAVDAINVFHPATYYGFDVDAIPDPLEKDAWGTMVRTYGQTPRQLFRTPHPMVVQNLMPRSDSSVPVVEDIKGLKWGNYVGSPSRSAPIIVWSNFYQSPVESLVPLMTNDVFGLPASTSLLLSYNKERSGNLVNEGVTLLGAALLSWGYPDGILRVKERKEQPQLPVVCCPPTDAISTCSTAPDCPYVWIGLQSGNILVFRYKFNMECGGVDFEPQPVMLLGHRKRVNSIYLSQSFGIAVSAGADGNAVIWDLNDLIYVRSIPNINSSIKLVAVSGTLGDIATVDVADNGSMLRLHTINAAFIGEVHIQEQITAICFSVAPEGVSVNVIATGLENGVIKLWSTWNLSLVREISNNTILSPVIGLTYSYDSQHLYASLGDGNVLIWEGTSSSEATKTPKFLNLTATN